MTAAILKSFPKAALVPAMAVQKAKKIKKNKVAFMYALPRYAAARTAHGTEQHGATHVAHRYAYAHVHGHVHIHV